MIGSVSTFTELKARCRAAAAAVAEQDDRGDEATRAARERAATRVDDLESALAEPLQIAFVGPFSTGKSLLIGALLGQPALLPDVGENPSTGNVTALLLVPVTEDEPEGPDGTADVELLTGDQVDELARELTESVLRAMASRVGPTDAAALRGAQAIGDDFAAIDAWLEGHWDAATVGDDAPDIVGGVGQGSWPAVRALLDLRDAWRSGGHLLGSSPLEVRATPSALLTLAAPPPLSDFFPRFDGLKVEGGDLDAEQMARLFPLIRQVGYRVRVRGWERGPFAEHAVQVVDFPGLLGDGTSVRDAFLSRLRLGGVHTVALTVRADQPATKAVDDVFVILEAAGLNTADAARRVVLVANRADQLALPPDPADFLELDAVRKLNAVLRDRLVGGRGQIALVSTMWGLTARELPAPSRTVQDETNAAAAERVRPTAQTQHGRIADVVTDSVWRTLLRATARDGGLDHLQQSLVDHVASHGVEAKLRAAKHTYRLLEQDLLAVERAERLRGLAVSAEQAEEVSRFVADLRQAAGRWRASAVELAADEDLVADLEATARRRSFRWPEWRVVLDTAQQGILPRTPAPIDGRRERPGDRTTVLRESFDRLVRRTAATGANTMYKAADAWIGRIDKELADFRERWSDQDLQDGLARLVQDEYGAPDPHDRPAEVLVAELLELPDRLREDVVALLSRLRSSGQHTASFPLRPDHLQPWARNTGQPDELRHVTIVLRMRANVACAAGTVVAGLVRAAGRGLVDAVVDRIVRLVADLPTADALPEPDHLPPWDTGRPALDDEAGPVGALLTRWREQA